MDKIAMRAMDFDNVITGVNASLCCRSKCLDNPLDIIMIHFFWRNGAGWAYGRRWRHNLPWWQAIFGIFGGEWTPIFNRAMA